jgi:hypothetical protein
LQNLEKLLRREDDYMLPRFKHKKDWLALAMEM